MTTLGKAAKDFIAAIDEGLEDPDLDAMIAACREFVADEDARLYETDVPPRPDPRRPLRQGNAGMSINWKAIEREEADLDRQLADGLLTQAEHAKEWNALQRDIRDMIEEEAQEAADRSRRENGVW